MEEHTHDPREPGDPWRAAAESWSDVGDKLRDKYSELVGDDGPSENDVRSALKTLGTAVQAVFDSLGAAMRDPEVRTQVKDATAGFASAVGQTFSELGEEIRRAAGSPPEGPVDADSEE
ncbi:MAG: hypothetical protein OEX04_01190 [Acidimicrobiia bacterium]|nr:hypothetical protein [Acidimicrobiia bacterium]MDH4306067.1 hypothetical protein [Acidimicrobiia bacterium]MDH5292585.1 hypothetical protein [Acidimicrobiia bacterium]